jgi:hypothetical protein
VTDESHLRQASVWCRFKEREAEVSDKTRTGITDVGVETGIRFTTTDADADHAYLRTTGVDADDVLRWPGVPAMFAFRDQDGNGLEIVEGA